MPLRWLALSDGSLWGKQKWLSSNSHWDLCFVKGIDLHPSGLEELDRFPSEGLENPNHDLRKIEWGETGSFPEGQGFVMLKCHWPAAGKEDWMMVQAGSKQCIRICGLQMPLTCLREVELGKGCPFHRVQRLQGQCSTPISGIRVGCLWSSS